MALPPLGGASKKMLMNADIMYAGVWLSPWCNELVMTEESDYPDVTTYDDDVRQFEYGLHRMSGSMRLFRARETSQMNETFEKYIYNRKRGQPINHWDEDLTNARRTNKASIVRFSPTQDSLPILTFHVRDHDDGMTALWGETANVTQSRTGGSPADRNITIAGSGSAGGSLIAKHVLTGTPGTKTTTLTGTSGKTRALAQNEAVLIAGEFDTPDFSISLLAGTNQATDSVITLTSTSNAGAYAYKCLPVAPATTQVVTITLSFTASAANGRLFIYRLETL